MTVIVLCIIIGFILGIIMGDWIYITVCGLPILCGLIIFTVNKITDIKIEKRRKEDPKFDKFMRDFERKWGKGPY